MNLNPDYLLRPDEVRFVLDSTPTGAIEMIVAAFLLLARSRQQPNPT